MLREELLEEQEGHQLAEMAELVLVILVLKDLMVKQIVVVAAAAAAFLILVRGVVEQVVKVL